jgi:hypothetical protein
MAWMTKDEFMNRLSDRERLSEIWDWLERLSQMDAHLGAQLQELKGKLSAAEYRPKDSDPKTP